MQLETRSDEMLKNGSEVVRVREIRYGVEPWHQKDLEMKGLYRTATLLRFPTKTYGIREPVSRGQYMNACLAAAKTYLLLPPMRAGHREKLQSAKTQSRPCACKEPPEPSYKLNKNKAITAERQYEAYRRAGVTAEKPHE